MNRTAHRTNRTIAFGIVLLLNAASVLAAAPRVTNIIPPSGSSASVLTEVTVTFDRPVNGVDARDLLVNDHAATAINGSGATYTFSFPQPNYGPVLVRFASDSAITAVGSVADLLDANAQVWTYTLHDVTQPAVAARHPPPGNALRQFLQVEVTFTEPVTRVRAEDLLLNGQPATNVLGASAGPYVFQFAASGSSGISLSWAGSQNIQDLAAQPNRFSGVGGWNYTVNANLPAANVVISEFLAGNVNDLRDENGATQDWIEIQNRGGTPVRLLGWSLSDNPGDTGRWTFPDVTVGAGEYLVIFASGLDRKGTAPGSRLHPNFKLSKGGDYLGLFNAESPRQAVSEFALGYPEQRNDFSFGLDPSNQWRYYRTPTPGGANGTSSIAGVAAPPEFSIERGFFNRFFFLTLSSPTPNSVIRYTTDGSEPTNTKGSVYAAPFQVNQTTVIRAATFKANSLPSTVVTHSYLFNQSPAVQSLPVLSITTDTNNLFGPTGIMEINPRNTIFHGIAWERPASVEWIRPEDNGGFQTDAGLRVLGGNTIRERYNYNAGPPFGKYSFGLYFRGDYGPTALNYPLFEHATLEAFDRVHLRAGFNDPLNPFLSDELVRRLFLDMGQVAAHGTFANLILNGVYKGYYNPTERMTPGFMQTWHGGGEAWDIIEQFEIVRDGTIDEWNQFRLFMDAGDFSIPAHYLEASRRFDLVNFVDYLLVNIYAATGDWPFINWRTARERVPGAKWRFYVWDAEYSFGYVQRNTVEHNEITNELALINNPTSQFYTKLKTSPEFRLLFADRVEKHFSVNGALSGTNVSARFEEMHRQLLGVIPTMNAAITNKWVPQRPGIIFQHMADAGLLAPVIAPILGHPGGQVPAGFNLSVLAPVGEVYYTTNGVDPRVTFTGQVAAEALRLPSGQTLTLNRSVTLKARSRLDGIWSALTEATFAVAEIGVPVRIVEIMYHPVGNEALEFLELQNLGGSTIDLGGMSFDGIDYRFPDDTLLAPGERLVLASGQNVAAFASRYPGVNVFGYYGAALSNGGERITLRDREGRNVVILEFDDENGWPLSADGLGPSLEIINAKGDPNDPANWRASFVSGGSPGSAPAGAVATVRLSEVMVRNVNAIQNGGGFPAWIELQNFGTTPVSLSEWSLSNDDNPRKFIFSGSTTLAPGNWLVVWCDSDFAAPGQHTGFVLTNEVERIFLYNAATQRVDGVTLSRQLENTSVSRVGEGWRLSRPTPGSGNTAAPVAPTSDLFINEWLANARPGESDWIELYNRNSSLPLPLSGLTFAVNGAAFRIQALLFLPPRSYVQLFADEEFGVNHLGFRLPAEGAKIVFYDEAGAIIDQVEYGAQVEGVSRGRLPDGGANIVSFVASSSPAAPNYVATYSGPVINEVMARNQSVTADSAGRFVDWFELFNPTASTFDLSGMSVSVDEPIPGQWTFPTGTTIGPNNYFAVSCDPLRSGSTSFTTELNTGLRLDGEGGGVFLFDRNGQLVNQVEFGFQVANQTLGRVGNDWRLLAQPTPKAANSAAADLGAGNRLRINEWMANPRAGDDWFEIYNPETRPVQLSGFHVTDDPSEAGAAKFTIGPLSFINAEGWVRLIADSNPRIAPNHVNFALDTEGETLRISDGGLQVVDSVDFTAQEEGVSQGLLPDGGSGGIASFPMSASPSEGNYLPHPDVVITEVLTYPSGAMEQAIELYNSGAQPVNIGGWFLSDDGARLKKFRIRDATIMAPRSFMVIYENAFNAGPGDTNSSRLVPFRLSSARAGSVHLASADRNGLDGWQSVFPFSGADFGISSGRHVTAGGPDFVPLINSTFGVTAPVVIDQFRNGTGASNAPPRIGPIIISEVHYHPVGVDGRELPDEEFIELRNASGQPVLLFDPVRQQNRWRLGGDVEFMFRDTLSLDPQALLVIVAFDPVADPAALNAFRAKYSVPLDIPVFGPFSGNLHNRSGLVELYKPGAPAPTGTDADVVPYVLVDRLTYSNQPPWPFQADGTGSLQRQNQDQLANDPLNWRGLPPTAGRDNAILIAVDSDGDGLPDSWESENKLSANNPTDANQDADGDGLTNLQEFLANTNPNSSVDRLQFTSVTSDYGLVIMSFIAAPGRTYAVQFRNDLPTAPWETVLGVEASATTRLVEVSDRSADSNRGFYRLVTPK